MKRIAVFCVTFNSDQELEHYKASLQKAAEKVGDEVTLDFFVSQNTREDNPGYFGGIRRAMLKTDVTAYDYAIRVADGDATGAISEDDGRTWIGFREVALNAIPFIDTSCCLYDEERSKIVCFYQSESDDTKAIIKFLSDKLPKYMWPNIFKRYDRLPMNKNSKIDRVKLKEEIRK